MRLIDLDKIKPMDFPSVEMDGVDVVRYLNTLFTVDAVEVVRCKDCKHWLDYGVCNRHITYPALWMEKNDFCSYGERRTDG